MAASFAQKESKPFERPYGWAWLLKLAEELHGWDDPDARAWSDSLRPLADAIVGRHMEFFSKQTYPIRTGVHPNTSFGLAFAHNYARAVGAARLEALVAERARAYFGADADAPARWEPSGADFFSPCLVEADLMRRVLPPAEFRAWFAGFLPGAARGKPASLFTPATVTDRTDTQLVHPKRWVGNVRSHRRLLLLRAWPCPMNQLSPRSKDPLPHEYLRAAVAAGHRPRYDADRGSA